MIIIDRAETNHTFEKQNLVTIIGKKGTYDIFKCSACGIKGKAYNFTEIQIDSKSKKKALNCPGSAAVKKIKITNCRAVGRQFENLTPGSIHEVIEPPAGYDNSRGVWVMGVGEPVKVLFGEFEEE